MDIVFRVDGSYEVGLGHLSRCINLAEELRSRGNNILFICRDNPGSNLRVLEQKFFKTILLSELDRREENNLDKVPHSKVTQKQDADETIEALGSLTPSWIVVDNYELDIEWETKIRPFVEKIAVFEDLPHRRHDCDLLLDQNYSDRLNDSYQGQVPKHCKCLLGPRYAVLDRAYVKYRNTQKVWPNKPKNIFVFCGGSDSKNLTGLTLEALNNDVFSSFEVDVIVGANNKHYKVMEKHLVSPNVKLHPSGENFVELMSKADLAIGAGGATTWERMCLGIPSLVVSIAKNQEYSCKELAKDGLIDYLGTLNEVKVETLRQALRNSITMFSELKAKADSGQVLVDGQGAKRVAECLSPTDINSLRIRAARGSDCIDYFNWANEPTVRAESLIEEKIIWSNHQRWFAGKIKSNNSELYVLTANELPIGQVRFDSNEESSEISFSLDPIVRKRGLSSIMVEKSISANRNRSVKPLQAVVKRDNKASRSVFIKLGFVEESIGDPLRNTSTFYRNN